MCSRCQDEVDQPRRPQQEDELRIDASMRVECEWLDDPIESLRVTAKTQVRWVEGKALGLAETVFGV